MTPTTQCLRDKDFSIDMDEHNWYLSIRLTNEKDIDPLKKLLITVTAIPKQLGTIIYCPVCKEACIQADNDRTFRCINKKCFQSTFELQYEKAKVKK